MSVFVVVGELSIKPEREASWRALPVDPSAFEWLEGAPVLDGTYAGGPTTVSDALDPPALRDANGVSFVEAVSRDGKLTVAAWLEGETVEPWLTGFLTALRLAGAAGAKGSVFVVPFGEQIVIEATCGKRSTLAVVPPQEALERHGRSVVEIHQWSLHKAKHPKRTRAEFRALLERWFLPPLGDSPREHARLVEAMRARGAKALLDAAKHATIVGPDDRPIAQALGSVKRVTEALEGDDPYLRAVGVYLLALLDPTAAAPLAMSLAKDASAPMRRSAYAALGCCASAEAVSALMTPDEDETARGAQLEAMGRLESPDLDATITRAVGESPDLRATAYAALASTTASPSVDDIAACEAAFARARHLVDIAAARRVEAVVPMLLAALPTAIPPNLRQQLCGALVAIGGAAVTAVQGKLQHAMFGMGLALNQDDVRRRELLRIATKEDSGGIFKFDELDLERFRALVEERFIDLGAQQNEAPPAGAFFALLTEHPEIRCHGYAVSKERDDYRVMVEGASCALDDVRPERRDAVKAAFAALCSEATQYDETESALYSWWT